jgi:peptidoglycan hydrolase-like protein with peptidoglycan-binding domain
MKKKTLIEELERIHTITYGKKLIGEGLWDKITSHLPKKADPTLVSADVKQFYDTLESIKKPLTQQEYGSMTYQKDVETLQMGLLLLGYQLPQHGIDGLFGPETAAAVEKFNQDNPSQTQSINETADDIRSTLGQLGYDEKGQEISSGGDITDDLTRVVSNILSDFKKTNPGVKVTITAGNDKFHQKLGYNSKHTEGKAIDLTLNPYNQNTDKEFKSVLDSYKQKDSNFSYLDEYTNPSGAATAGHFHLQYGGGSSVEGEEGVSKKLNGIVATPEMVKTMITLLKEKGVKSEELNQLIKTVNRGSGEIGNIDVNDWQGMVDLIIDKLEGGYFHPDMLKDGRVRDMRYGNSGETMFGMDRKNGGQETQSPAANEFWNIIDAQDAKDKWPNEYMLKDNPSLNNQLRKLVGEIMKPIFEDYTKKYLSPHAADIMKRDKGLLFNFIYATWNGPGWFRDFAKPINQAVEDGTTDPKELLNLAISERNRSSNSLIAQAGHKVADIANQLSTSGSSSENMA